MTVILFLFLLFLILMSNNVGWYQMLSSGIKWDISYTLITHTWSYLLITVDGRCIVLHCYIKIMLARKDPMKLNDTITFTINYVYVYFYSMLKTTILYSIYYSIHITFYILHRTLFSLSLIVEKCCLWYLQEQINTNLKLLI